MKSAGSPEPACWQTNRQTDRQIDLVLANSYNCTQVKWESSTLSWKQHHWPIYSPGLYLFSGRPCLSPNRPCPLLFYWTPPNKITCPFSHSSSHSTTSFSHALPSLKKTVCFIQIFVVICPYWYAYTLKNKGSLLASMVIWRILNIHGTLQMQKRFFTVEKGSLDFLNLLQNGSFRNCSLKVSSGNQKWFFYRITAKTPFWSLYI